MGGDGCILQMRPCDDNFLIGRRQTHSHAPKSLTGPPLKVLLVSGNGVITQWVLCNYLIKPPPSPQRGAGRLTRPCPPLSPRRLISSSCWEGERGPKPCFLRVTAGLRAEDWPEGGARSPWGSPGLSTGQEFLWVQPPLFCFEDTEDQRGKDSKEVPQHLGPDLAFGVPSPSLPP